MTTLVTFYNRSTNQYYARLHQGVIGEDEKLVLLAETQAVNAGNYAYGEEPQDCNRLYFQEFAEPDTAGVYYNINGDRPVYDILETYGRKPEYCI